MLEAVPSGRSQVRFSFRADFFSDGFYGFHTAKTNVEGAYRDAPHSSGAVPKLKKYCALKEWQEPLSDVQKLTETGDSHVCRIKLRGKEYTQSPIICVQANQAEDVTAFKALEDLSE